MSLYNQKGFSPIFIIIGVIALLVIAFFWFSLREKEKSTPAYPSFPSSSQQRNNDDLYKNVSAPFKKYFPQTVNDLTLVQLDKGDYEGGCRGVPVSDKELEKICLAEAFRGFYAFTGSDFFVKMHVDKSKTEDFQSDLNKIKKGLEALKNSGGNAFVQAEAEYKNLKYSTNDRIQLGEGVAIGQAVIIVPDEQVVVTIYFTNKGIKNKTNSIAEYQKIKEEFVHKIIDSAAQ